MKFSIDKNVFAKALDEVNRSIDSNNIFMILRNFYLEVLDDLIIIRGSNGYFSIENKIENNEIINITQTGKALIPGSLFLNIIKKCSGKIDLETINNQIVIKNEKDKFEINLYENTDYPTIDFSLYGKKIKINAQKLREAINHVIFSTAQNQEDIILAGLNIKYKTGKLILTATDSFRLSREIIEIVDDRDISFDATIMNKNIKNLIPSNIEDEIIMYVNEQKINIVYNNLNLQSKIIEAPYKDVDFLFDKTFDKQVVIQKNIFNNAISKATVLTGEAGNNQIIISIDKNEIKMFANSEEVGKTNVVISNENFSYNSDDHIEIVLNSKFLKDAIGVFNDKIYINLLNSNSIVLIKDETKSNMQIISPIKS